ncbi:transposase [Kandleria sp.]|uniref:transposase n=1 Tax=Kandleria sp. TaxID=2774291 RepID=UPI001B6E8A80|nr:transposase [Kandleria sp.]MBP3277016.1 transposase [Kandleria sp.]
MSTTEIEKRLFRIDYKLEKMRDLKELYINFNKRTGRSNPQINDELDAIILAYKKSDIQMFMDFAYLLCKYREPIINSFVALPNLEKEIRISNSPVERFNRKPKDLLRLAHGTRNFEAFRLRLLFNNRKDKIILREPLLMKEIKNHTEVRRGYNAKKTTAPHQGCHS